MYMSIAELAKLRNVSTDTLRYYDKIGLFKPAYVDPQTHYRYYSVLQYEKLGTINELRKLDMSLHEIKKFFDHRNVSQSISILEIQEKKLSKIIKDYVELHKIVSEKILFLNNVIKQAQEKKINIKTFPERRIIKLGHLDSNDEDISHFFLNLENIVKYNASEIAPIVASNRMGYVIFEKDIKASNFLEVNSVFAFVKDHESVDEKYVTRVPAGKYVCLYYNGLVKDREESVKKMLQFIRDHGFNVLGDALQILQIDITVTDIPEEVANEIQIPIEVTI